MYRYSSIQRTLLSSSSSSCVNYSCGLHTTLRSSAPLVPQSPTLCSPFSYHLNLQPIFSKICPRVLTSCCNFSLSPLHPAPLPCPLPLPPPIPIKDTVIPCSEGNYSLGLAQSCTPCQVGYSCNDPESDVADPCPWGTFAVGGRNVCTECPAGFTCRSVYLYCNVPNRVKI